MPNTPVFIARLALVALSTWLAMLFAPAAFKPPRLRADDQVQFQRDIRPLLQKHCAACHGPEMQEGGLRLDLRTPALRGGDNGPVLKPGDLDSELLRRVASDDKDEFMPPKGERLMAAEIDILRRWIKQGADWPETDADRKAVHDPKLDHWAWKPLVRPAVPTPSGSGATGAAAIDAFIDAKLAERQWQRSPAADRRTLARRVAFDLTGLPLAPEELERFATDDAPQAYAQLIDRLLDSPAYGERWARHWLDVVHYGDTHGYDKDKLRPNAWPYRDYVIRALNEDRPYARFIAEQVAGDVLYPGTRDGIEALGFISAGPWDFIGHAEVPESKIDGKIARHLDRDDMVANTIGTFCSVTIHCAQCHNHKFDPFTQEDYYSLQAVFAAVDRADRTYYPDAAAAQQFARWTDEKRRRTDHFTTLDKQLRDSAGPPLAELEARIAAAKKSSRGNAHPEFGYHSQIAATPGDAKWVQLDLGRSRLLRRVVVRPCYDDFNQIGAGFGFPPRYRVELSDSPDFPTGATQTIASFVDQDVPNPGTAAQTFPVDNLAGRYLRITATKLAPRQNDYIFALAELEAYDDAGVNVARQATVAALDSIEAGPRWRKSNLVDGLAPHEDESAKLPELLATRDQLLRAAADAPTYAAWDAARAAVDEAEAELKKLPPPSVAYVGTVHHGSGAFSGTGATGGKPRPIHILSRGNVLQPGREVGPGAISALAPLHGRFDLPADHREGERRAALAKWLADPQNPLTWRSIVNRVWQYHFGRGIVETSNDFGRMGATPTHPELLDWLACEFRDGGGSLKQLHRLICLSETYRQSSAPLDSPAVRSAAAGDAENRLLWRQNRRKLEAEAVHDAVLAVSGKLDSRMGGPGYQDFVIEHPEHSPHYQYHLADPNDPRTWRRSVYRFIVRSQTQPFMTSLDCADPSMRVEKRNESVSPIQALALLNNGFMVVQARYFAERVEKEAGSEPPRQVARAVQLAFGRLPTDEETTALVAFVREHGLANACRVLLNANEFTFVD